jgi:hypothetical protein
MKSRLKMLMTAATRETDDIARSIVPAPVLQPAGWQRDECRSPPT